MKSTSRLLSSLLTTCIALSLFAVTPVHASEPAVESVTPVSVTFAEMGFEGRTFEGPYSMAGFGFYLPDEWQLQPGSSINLKYTVRMPDGEKKKALSTGVYSYMFVHMNYTQLAYIPLKASGDYELKIPISLWVAPLLPMAATRLSLFSRMILPADMTTVYRFILSPNPRSTSNRS
jgi:hypothetical protein